MPLIGWPEVHCSQRFCKYWTSHSDAAREHLMSLFERREVPVVKGKPKVSLCINTHNEGPDLWQTFLSFRNAWDGPFEVVVVADGTTDDSLKPFEELHNRAPLMSAFLPVFELRCPNCGEADLDKHVLEGQSLVRCGECDWRLNWTDEDSVKIIRNAERVGCGRAKQQALQAATGDVIIHADGHCRVLKGDLAASVEKALAENCIIAPGVAPLHCERDRQFDAKRHKWDPDHCSYGGKIGMVYGGAKVKSKWLWHEKKDIFRPRTATWYAIFMGSRDTFLNRLGGWNEYPGCWGSQEIGLALRAWFAAVPIYATRSLVVGHRYASDSARKADKNWKYPIRTSERRANHYYSHLVTFDKKTAEDYWKPLWKERLDSDGAWKRMEGSALELQGQQFRDLFKRRTDEEFFATFGRCVDDPSKDELEDGDVPKEKPVPHVENPLLLTGDALVRDLYNRKVAERLLAEKAVGSDLRRTSPPMQGLPPAPEAPETVPCSNVTAVLLNYKRPRYMQMCVDAIRKGGVENVWVWCQENAEPPKGATRVFRDSQNAVTWARYLVAGLVETDWILFCDDDCEITEAGMLALRVGAAKYDRSVGLMGFALEDPFDHYRTRKIYKAHHITEPKVVDFLWPKGMLVKRDTAQRVFGESKWWQKMRDLTGLPRGDDIIAHILEAELFGQPPMVVPCPTRAFDEHFTEGKQFALWRQPSMKAKQRSIKTWREWGWKPVHLQAQEKTQTERYEPYDSRVEHWERWIGGEFKQQKDEVREVFKKVEALRPEVFVEIGSEAGASLYTYAGACQKTAKVIALDIGNRPAKKHLKRTMTELGKELYQAHWLRADSHSKATQAELKKLLGGKKIDFLHIDGDHSYHGVRKDWLMYSKFVRPGGLIAIHDVARKDLVTKVYQFWPVIKEKFKTEEVVIGDIPYNKSKTKRAPVGIGLVWW